MAKNRNQKRDSLLVLIALESRDEAQKLLQKYGIERATSTRDLEDKLSRLYFTSADKLTLEKEFADIHPHKKWIFKTLQPPVEVKEEVKVESVSEPKSNCSGCKCGGACGGNCGGNCPCKAQSSFDGGNTQKAVERQDSNQIEKYMGLIALVAVVGITFHVITKANK